jgi:hypothetical protein
MRAVAWRWTKDGKDSVVGERNVEVGEDKVWQMQAARRG